MWFSRIVHAYINYDRPGPMPEFRFFVVFPKLHAAIFWEINDYDEQKPEPPERDTAWGEGGSSVWGEFKLIFQEWDRN